jgi:hypothetical protein
LGLFPVSHARLRESWGIASRTKKRAIVFSRGGAD